MCILMLFNERPSWSYREMKSATGIETTDLKRHLISLCTPKFRILLKSSKGKGIEDNDEFVVNQEYKSKLHKVRIPLVSLNDSTGLSEAAALTIMADELPATVAEDRKHLIEAAIVRIMKTRKSMQHNNLMAEVTRQLTSRFVPSPQMIKRRIESLIEREYLTRHQADRRLYNYVA
jgi:cullin 3